MKGEAKAISNLLLYSLTHLQKKVVGDDGEVIGPGELLVAEGALPDVAQGKPLIFHPDMHQEEGQHDQAEL